MSPEERRNELGTERREMEKWENRWGTARAGEESRFFPFFNFAICTFAFPIGPE